MRISGPLSCGKMHDLLGRSKLVTRHQYNTMEEVTACQNKEVKTLSSLGN